MNTEFSVNDNKLIINSNIIEFRQSIKDAQLLVDKIIVLLSIPQNDCTIDNLYAVDINGKVIWQSQNLEEIYPTEKLLPYEQIFLDTIIKAIDFYGRRYFINPDNGKIIKRDVIR